MVAHGRGLDRRKALIEAGRIRLRPILMTTLALIAGMVPVAMGLGEGADFRAPLGRAVIGGVITSTVLTLVVIPTVYEILDEWRERLLARFGRKARAHLPSPCLSPATSGISEVEYGRARMTGSTGPPGAVAYGYCQWLGAALKARGVSTVRRIQCRNALLEAWQS